MLIERVNANGFVILDYVHARFSSESVSPRAIASPLNFTAAGRGERLKRTEALAFRLTTIVARDMAENRDGQLASWQCDAEDRVFPRFLRLYLSARRYKLINPLRVA